MHEFSIATDVMNNAIDEAKKHNAVRIKEISLEIGKMAMINPEQMRFALEMLSKETIAEGAKMDLEILPLRVECMKNHISEVDFDGENLYSTLSKLRCPQCNGDVRVLGGRECILRRIVAE